MEKTKDIIVRQIGQVQLSVSQFTEDQRVVFEKVLNIVDRNPSVDWNNDKNGHNRDFCLVENNIEPVKEFCLKVQFIAALSMQAVREMIEGEGVDARCVSTVRIWKAGDPRFVELSGGSTAAECGAKREKANKRYFHDMLGRAQTRAFKAALEAYMGFPFINLAIQMVFGTYDVKKPEDEGIGKGRGMDFGNDVSDAEFTVEGDEKTDDKQKQDNKEKEKDETDRKAIVNKIWVAIKAANKAGIYSDEERDRLAERLKANKMNMEALLRIKIEVDREIDVRKNKR